MLDKINNLNSSQDLIKDEYYYFNGYKDDNFYDEFSDECRLENNNYFNFNTYNEKKKFETEFEKNYEW